MPYDGEFAQYTSLQRLAQSERVKTLLSKYTIRKPPADTGYLPPLANVLPSDWQPDYVLSIDGSPLPVAVETGYPEAEVGYITIAAVLIDVAKQRALDRFRPADPKEFRKTQVPSSIDEVIPGANVVFDGDSSARASMRRALLEVFASEKNRMSETGETLLDTYHALLVHKPVTTQLQRCPYLEDGECGSSDPDQPYTRAAAGVSTHACPCSLKRPLYSTDALRIHEGMTPEGGNETMYAEVMQVWERLLLIHILRTMEQNHSFLALKSLAIILDGPLAVFGRPAWLSQAIYKELCRLNAEAKKVTHQDILLIGVEKTGKFVDHFARLDKKPSGESGAFPKEAVALLTDAYIKERIIFSDPNQSKKPYAQDTYFGRKLLYKTRSGARIVAVTPYYDEAHREMNTAEPSQHPRLADVMSILNQLVSSRYPDALAPLVAANSEAAIPLNLGTKVLEQLARDLIQKS